MRVQMRFAFLSLFATRAFRLVGGLKHEVLRVVGRPRGADPEKGAAETDAATGLSDLFSDEIQDMLKQFNASAVRQRLQAPKPIVFVHVHKSLGTWFCWAGREAGAHTPMNDGDCANPEDNIWSNKPWEYYDFVNDCRSRSEMVQTHGYTMHEIERFVDFRGEPQGDWCASDFTYAIIMRHPIKRIQSQMKANQATFDQVKQWLSVPVVLDHPAGVRLVNSHVPFDNFYVRTLCGRDCYTLPPGQLTRNHLEKAKKQLAKLDAVIVADNLLTDLVQIEALTSLKLQDLASHQVHNSMCANHQHFKECMTFAMTDEQHQMMRKHNKLDLDLYAFSKQIAKNRTLALR